MSEPTIPLLKIDLNSSKDQYFLCAEKHRTYFAIFGKIKTRKKDKEEYIDEITLNYRRIGGLINYSFNRILNVEIVNGDGISIPKELLVTNINVQLRAFTNKVAKTTFSPSYDVPIKIGDIIHLKIDNEILNLDTEDDITGSKEIDQIDICFSKITGG